MAGESEKALSSCGWAISLKQIVSARVKTACRSRPRITTELHLRPDRSSTFSSKHRQLLDAEGVNAVIAKVGTGTLLVVAVLVRSTIPRDHCLITYRNCEMGRFSCWRSIFMRYSNGLAVRNFSERFSRSFLTVLRTRTVEKQATYYHTMLGRSRMSERRPGCGPGCGFRRQIKRTSSESKISSAF